MTGRTRQNKDVPNQMGEFQPAIHDEDTSDRVDDRVRPFLTRRLRPNVVPSHGLLRDAAINELGAIMKRCSERLIIAQLHRGHIRSIKRNIRIGRWQFELR